MSEHGTPTPHPAGGHAAWRPCPAWCVRHHQADIGTPDEFLVHIAEDRDTEGVAIDLRQVEFLDGKRDHAFLYVDEVEMTAADATRVAAALSRTVADALSEATR
jgi:hypothetical protein